MNPLAWVIWLGAVLASLSATRNPFYLGLALVWIGVVAVALRPPPDAPRLPFSPLRFGLVVVVLSALFNGLTVHVGSTRLFTLPRSWPLLGGPVTLEAAVYGALNGLVLAGMFAAFSVLNRALPVRAMVRLIPRAFYPAAVVVSIAVTFAPATLRQFEQIREAQAVRGHRVRGLRDWLPLWIPLLVGGMERALQLAEAMTARGFAAGEGRGLGAASQGAMVAGLGAVLAGWLLRLVWGQATAGTLLLAGGIGLVGGVLWETGRRFPHTVYRPTPWTRRDSAAALLALATAAAFLLPLPGLDRSSIFYYPYPRLLAPALHPLIAAATLGLLGPVFANSHLSHGQTDD